MKKFVFGAALLALASVAMGETFEGTVANWKSMWRVMNEKGEAPIANFKKPLADKVSPFDGKKVTVTGTLEDPSAKFPTLISIESIEEVQ